MSLNTENFIQDWNKKYQNTLGRYSFEDIHKVVEVLGMFQKRGDIFVELRSEDTPIIINLEGDYSLDFSWPASGFFWCHNCPCLLYRVPERQWKVGLNKTNCKIFMPDSKKTTWNQVGPSLSIIGAAFKDEPTPSIISKRVAYRKIFDRTFMYYWNKPVAEIVGKDVLVGEKLFQQELLDELRGTSFMVK